MPESMNFSFTQLHVELLIPMCISLLGGIILLGVGVFNKTKSRELYVSISILFVLLNLGFLLIEGNLTPQVGFFNLLLVDHISYFAQILILLCAFIILLFFMHNNTLPETQKAEFYALFLFAIAGFAFMVSSENLILMLLGLECASLSIYALIALHDDIHAFESSIKYFVMGSVASALLCFGALLLYAATGSIEMGHIGAFMQEHANSSWLAILGFIFLLCALGFKTSLVPFHTWTPDVYQGSNALIAGFIAIAPKIAALAVMIRIFEPFIQSHNTFVQCTLFALIVLSISIPNLIALVQKDVKRMLAYSSISHSGFVLSAILLGLPDMVFLYWFFFLFANLGAFGILWLCKKEGSNDISFDTLKSLITTNPTLAILLTFFMFALAGIPPFCVFWGKIYLIQNALGSHYIILALLMALNSIINAFYYLKVVIYIFNTQSARPIPHISLSLPSIFALAITAIVSIGAIFMVQNLLELLAKYGNSGF
ncbi:NADH-quinone oxidoreductase subunit NuoN [Helicobacter marmotae]|uniref:NADH-quinone oxidoreductase subunit N n=1 Tax=Helicobacter marmotae TaxID=152490 RepID=A0A3D8I5R5_9HELI|nr:NADH-quinone oxidoreductase subunit NuoN [Helicobacter marmotae]RDU60447.1 NADH-quinone oxidoreductase subunit NuoN [Helicobacter marmotae]